MSDTPRFDLIEQAGRHAQIDFFEEIAIADAAFALQGEIDSGRQTIVGVNAFTEGDDPETPILHIDPALERKQVERLRAARAARESATVEATLAAVKQAANAPHTSCLP
jgi:methylmalonyl-CoA mutase, N-terminal domain